MSVKSIRPLSRYALMPSAITIAAIRTTRPYRSLYDHRPPGIWSMSSSTASAICAEMPWWEISSPAASWSVRFVSVSLARSTSRLMARLYAALRPSIVWASSASMMSACLYSDIVGRRFLARAL